MFSNISEFTAIISIEWLMNVFHAVTVQCEQILFGVLVSMILQNIHR